MENPWKYNEKVERIKVESVEFCGECLFAAPILGDLCKTAFGQPAVSSRNFRPYLSHANETRAINITWAEENSSTPTCGRSTGNALHNLRANCPAATGTPTPSIIIKIFIYLLQGRRHKKNFWWRNLPFKIGKFSYFFVHFPILIFLGNRKKKLKFLLISNFFTYFSIWGRDFCNELILCFKICLK